MRDLEDLAIYDAIDPGGMGLLIAGFADQCRSAWRNVAEFHLPAKYQQARILLVVGMGGSAIGGDLLRTLVANESQVPVIISREYGVPAWVNEETLVIVSSHSGNTEETLSAMHHARSKGAMIVGVTTGGELAQASGIPILKYEFESQPRAALSFSFISLLGIVAGLGWIADPTSALYEGLNGIEELNRTIVTRSPLERNPAKQLALKLVDRIPVVYAARPLQEVAHRWKTQFNENSKTVAFHDAMSELNHNSVVGYEFPPKALRSLSFVFLLSKRDDSRIQRRFRVTSELIARRGLDQEAIDVQGDSALGEMLWAIHFGDFVSYYLAILNGADPTPVLAIDFLKNALMTKNG